MEKKTGVYVQEPTFLSQLDLHYRMLSDSHRELVISELKKVKENIADYRVLCKDTNEKSR